MKDTEMKDSTEITVFTPEGAEAFLASDYVEGIGKVFAAKLVKEYGADVIRRLKDDPESITSVPGLGSSRIMTASHSLASVPVDLSTLLFLYSTGIPDLFISRILGKYRKKAGEIILKDPYTMVEDVWRLSFFTADKIGKFLGIAPDDPRRLRGALLTAVKHYAENGHLFATKEEAVYYASEITGVEHDKIAAVIDSLVADGRLVSSRGGLYLPVFYKAEKNGAEKLLSLVSVPATVVDLNDIPRCDMRGHEYTQMQRRAIRLALENPVTVLTGGPGTGKTTVLKGILDILAADGKKFILAAPTGRAAKRMSTLTGFEATTIHRLLGYRQGEGYHNKNIETDALIIDEGSMMEQVLLDHLLQAVKSGTKIIIVGDVDQLPAIGAGDVMRELIRSGTVPVIVLDENFRQNEGSMIAANARAINKGEMPESEGSEDFLIFEEKGVPAIHKRVLELVAEELPRKYNISPHEILVVTPQQMGPLGARQLNIDLQKRLNPEGPEIKRGLTVMRLGDPVMQTANSRQRDLFNGETGRIVEVDPEHRWLVVEFTDGRRSTYSRSELSELILAYATTVHKLQGSETDYLVMPVTMAHKPMLYRNLLYTGVSRAKKLCALVGESEALRYAIENIRDVMRNSNFCSRLAFQNGAGDSK